MTKFHGWKKAYIVFVFSAAAAIASPAQTFNTLVNFDGANGVEPEYMSLVQGIDGNLYGTTYSGGAHGGGTVFKITPGGALTTLYKFCARANCADGQDPAAGLVLATDENFYGTTANGGANRRGTVFKITSAGALTTLYSFCARNGCPDGEIPNAGLVQGTDGNFYGTTYLGGAPAGHGTIFKITPGGVLTTLLRFRYFEGDNPEAGLVQGTNGDFYGTTPVGGTHDGNGTVFRITPRGTRNTLYNFCAEANCADGAGPFAGLVQAIDGNFYGTTEGGGAASSGTVFKITPRGALSTLYSFCTQANCADGAGPLAGLVQAIDENFYGTTAVGGVNGDGTVFKITPRGALSTLHSFDFTDGSGPVGGLVQATNGSFYGTTGGGGANNYGTVFSLSVGLGPFIETLPTSGKVGAKVIILGNKLTSASSVTFNGTAATFKVVRSTEITTTVPTGATSGTVEVTTPGGTLKSNVVFRVRQ
jgi:uncharacterized repeat protein (TIGR03803 family)